MAGKTVLILGGGVGGLVAANELRKRLGQEDRILIIDKQAQYIFSPSFLWLILGWREPVGISRDLRLLERKGIEYFNTEVIRIDPEKKVVETSAQQKLSYDYLIVALGAELAPEAIPGFPQAAHNLYQLEGAIGLRDALKDFSGGTIIVLISSMPYKCPAAPYESALLMDYFFRTKGLRSRVEVSIFTPEPHPMPAAGPENGQALRQLVESRDIAFNPNNKAALIDSEKREITFENGQRKRFDLLVGIPGHRGPKVAAEAGLTNEMGWIPVDKNSLKTKYENVYAIGDVTAIKLPGQYKPEVPLMLPKAGVFAHSQAEVVVQNIAQEITGTGSKKEFDGRGSCFLETGWGKSGFAIGDFYAQPHPIVNMQPPSRWRHWEKVLFEKYWLWRWF